MQSLHTLNAVNTASQKLKFPTPPVSLTEHPASLPGADIRDDIDHTAVASSGLRRLPNLSLHDLTENAIWRDSLALTGTLRTFFGPGLVAQVWKDLSFRHRASNFTVIPESSRIVRLGPQTSWVEARFSFDISGPLKARCSGTIGLIPDDSTDQSGWRIWLLSTILEQPEGFPDVDDLRPPSESKMKSLPALTNGSSLPTYVDCLVVGASIGGLCMAGHLQALGLSYLVVESTPNVGDTWRHHRYDSLKLHTSRCYNQLPGTPATFRKDDNYHLTVADIADGFQRYVDTFGINTSLSTTLVSGTYDQDLKEWKLKLQRDGEASTIRARHVVLAVGSMGKIPTMPNLPGRENFKGDVLHGKDWRNASPWKTNAKTKSGVVVGSANTAQGAIADMAYAGFKSVTMVQRSKTFLFPSSAFSALVDPVYNDDMPTTLSDRMLFGYPLPIQRLTTMVGTKMCAEQNAEYFERIEAQGFDAERNGDLWGMMYDREGGHFFDLGSSDLIADGTVKVKSGIEPVAYTETGLEMSDGSHLAADVIVFATGYKGNIRDAASKLFGESVGDELEEFWQCDKEGESRGAWKDVGHPRLWYTGHGFGHCRYYSRFVAMHIKADVDGAPIEIYTETPDVQAGISNEDVAIPDHTSVTPAGVVASRADGYGYDFVYTEIGRIAAEGMIAAVQIIGSALGY